MRGQGLTVLILAGGRSRRMGQDKIWRPLGAGAVPLIERVVARIRPLADGVSLQRERAGTLRCAG